MKPALTLAREEGGFFVLAETAELLPLARETAGRLEAPLLQELPDDFDGLILRLGKEGAALQSGNRLLRCDFTRLLHRIRPAALPRELLIKAAKSKNAEGPQWAVDATAGLGEDSLLLAAAGFSVTLYERDPVIALLLRDGLRRALEHPELRETAGRMTVLEEDSLAALPALPEHPDLIYLDPMFPAREKSALVKKKFQLLHHLELPCEEEEQLLAAALAAHPRKVVVKRPLKGPFLAEQKPNHSIRGKTVRYDCILP